MRTMRLCLFAVLLMPVLPAAALDFQIVKPDQAAFHDVATDMTAAFDYKALGPSAPTGITGVSAGLYGTFDLAKSSGSWNTLTGSGTKGLGTAGVMVGKGLPLGLDVGAFYALVPTTSAHVYGVDARYAILDGTALTPAVSIRGSYTAAGNLGDMAYHSFGADLAISQNFLLLTPYGGLGYVESLVRADGKYGLHSESIDRVKAFGGVRFQFGPFQTSIEYERLGGNDAFSARFGISL